MPEISCSEWNEFLSTQPDAHILQSGEWGELKSVFGWDAVRVVKDGLGAQILFRRLPLGLTFAYVEAFQAEAERLIDTATTDSQFFDLVADLFPTPDADAPTRVRRAHTQKMLDKVRAGERDVLCCGRGPLDPAEASENRRQKR